MVWWPRDVLNTNKIAILLGNWGRSLPQGRQTQPLLRGEHIEQSWLVSYKGNVPGATREGFPDKKGEACEEKFSALH